MNIDKQKVFARLTAACLGIHSIDKIVGSRRRNVIPDHIHVEHLLSIYEDLYPCTSHPSDIINIPARPQELAIGNTPPHYSIASFVEGCVLRLGGWMDEFYFFIKATYQSNQDHGHADYKILYSLHKKTRGLGADTMDWILCQALRSYPPKHPRMLEMIGHYFYSMPRNSENSENSAVAGFWYQWLRLARFQVFGPRHPATTGKLDRITVPKQFISLLRKKGWKMQSGFSVTGLCFFIKCLLPGMRMLRRFNPRHRLGRYFSLCLRCFSIYFRLSTKKPWSDGAEMSSMPRMGWRSHSHHLAESAKLGYPHSLTLLGFMHHLI